MPLYKNSGTAATTTFDDTTFNAVSSGAITGDDVQEILDDQLTYLVGVFVTLFTALGALEAVNIIFDNSGNGFTASNVQTAIEEAATAGGAVDSVNGQTGAVVLDGGDIANTPAGNIAATDVQTAINELDTEKVKKSGDTMTGDLTIAPSGSGSLLYMDSPYAAEIFVDRGSDSYQGLVRFRTAGANSWYFGLYTTGVEDFELHRGGGGTSGFIMDYTTQYVKLKYGLELTYGTASTVPYIDSSKNLVSSAVTPAELGYVSGVTSAIQTQLNTKPTISSGTSAPASTPGKVGDTYIDTSAKKLYFATGTSSSADWTIAN